ncbi:MAG: hypothetical protein FWG98_06260 [Candidatus Cloacimonetes bacterium]|nr:hypothetical protein [Candidatus Cloacimonadota bacterium]
MNKKSTIISIVKGFQTAINIAYDLRDYDKINRFIPTQSSLDIFEDILLSTATNSTQRAHTLIGAYGRGKSHIILVLLSLLSGNKKDLFTTTLEKIRKNNQPLYEFVNEYINNHHRLLPIVVHGNNTSLSSSFLSALELTLKEEGMSDLMPETHFQAAIATIDSWEKQYPHTYELFSKELPCSVTDFGLSLKEYDTTSYEIFKEIYPKLTSGSLFNPFLGFDIVEIYESVTKGIKEKGYNGIFVLYDEFSKYLESSISKATINDIKLLQDFAEKCNRSGNHQMHLLLICHKDISNYINGHLPKEKIDGWRGVSGRFKHIHLYNNYTQIYEIISEVIMKTPSFENIFKEQNKVLFEELIQRFTTNGLIDETNKDEIENVIFGCFPLHPISTFILPRLSEKVAQNERTLFTFLSSDDRNTLSAFLTNSKKEFSLLTPDYLYDYFEPLLRKEVYTSEIHKIYKLTTKVLQKIDASSLGSKIIKTIALIYIVEHFEKLSPTVNMIINTFINDVDDVKLIYDELNRLIEQDYIIYLKRSNNYLKIKESSGINIPSETSNFIATNRYSMQVKEILNRSAFDGFLYPTRYNDKYEITRYFDFLFIDSNDFFETKNWEKRILNTKADGVVYAIIPENEDEVETLHSKVKNINNEFSRVLFIIPLSYTSIENIAFEYEAVKSLRERVDNDDLLADEYEVYLDDLTEVMSNYVNNYICPENKAAHYYYNGDRCIIYRRSQLSEKLSEICEQVYCRTPIINNETINKNLISGQALNSRTRLIAGILSKELMPNLGLVGTGQEVSFMRSVLVQTGIIEDIKSPKINLEPNDENLCYILKIIRDFFLNANSGDGSSFSDLYNLLILPENHIGLKLGLIPIFIAIVLSFERQIFIFKHRDVEIKITPDILNAINENPEDYTVMLENWNSDKAAYLEGLEKVFSEFVSENEKTYNNFTAVLVAMNKWFMSLPRYAKDLNKCYRGNNKFEILDQRKKKFINSLRQIDSNPREFLFTKVFLFLGKQEILSNAVPLINEIKNTWDNAISELIKALVQDIKAIFTSNNSQASLPSVVKDWYESLSEKSKHHLYACNENRILSLISSVTNDEATFVQRLAKAVTSLRIEDWNNDTILVFFKDLRKFKETIDAYNNEQKNRTSSVSNEYKITFTDENGNEISKSFERISYSNKAKLLFREIESSIEEMGQSITELEKRQVLVEILQKLC